MCVVVVLTIAMGTLIWEYIIKSQEKNTSLQIVLEKSALNLQSADP